MRGVRGYKVFNPDWTCRGFQYEVGKVFEEATTPEVCVKGFHFCKRAVDCFNYYSFNPDNKVAEVIALGDIDEKGNKCSTNKIHILREISWEELLNIVNTGKGNSGHSNSGNENSGDWNSGDGNSGDWNSGNGNSGDGNSGDWNSGNRNSGNRNSGHENSGDENSGHWNSGDGNSGDWNSGNRNSGNRNSGDFNSGGYNSGDFNSGSHNSGDFNITDGNSGCFCTEAHTIKFFDKDSNWTLEDWRMSDAYRLLRRAPLSPVKWIPKSDMTDEEKAEHPEHTITGGYLKELSIEERTEVAQEWWDSLDADGKQKIKNIPNFDPVKFKQITGIEVD